MTTEVQRREVMSQSKAGKAGLIYVDGIKKVEQTKEYAIFRSFRKQKNMLRRKVIKQKKLLVMDGHL